MATSILQDLQWRYATKKFDATKKIPAAKLHILKEAFNLTATSYGLQPIKLLVVRNPIIQADLVPLTMHQKQVENASHVLIFCIQETIDASYVSRYFDLVRKVRNTDEEILAPFREFLIRDFNERTADEIRAWATNQAYLAMGNLLTVCALEGIDSCPIEGFSPEGYDAYFQLKEKGLRSVLVLAVGYRASDDFFADFKKVRKGTLNLVEEISD